MDSTRSKPSPSDIAELQRDCHPFNSYIDYIQGRPTEYERMMQSQVSTSDYGQEENPLLQESVAAENPIVPAYGMPALHQQHRTNSFQYRYSSDAYF
jgi:hypothetical protein